MTEEQTLKRWRCLVCGYIFIGEEAPSLCPICLATEEKFVEDTGNLDDLIKTFQ